MVDELLHCRLPRRPGCRSRALEVVIDRWCVHQHVAYPDITPAQKGFIPFAQPVAHSIYENLILVKGCVGILGFSSGARYIFAWRLPHFTPRPDRPQTASASARVCLYWYNAAPTKNPTPGRLHVSSAPTGVMISCSC